MEKKVRVFDLENACYGIALAEDFNNHKLAVIKVEFYKNKSQKDEEPRYKLVKIRDVKRVNLK
jgi:hypothetical protein